MRHRSIIAVILVSMALLAAQMGCGTLGETKAKPAGETSAGDTRPGDTRPNREQQPEAGPEAPAEQPQPMMLREDGERPSERAEIDPVTGTHMEKRGPAGPPEMRTEDFRRDGETARAVTAAGTAGDRPGNMDTTLSKSDPGELPAMPARGSSHYSPPMQSDLKAGEVNDNRNWNKYLEFVEDYQGPEVHPTNLERPQVVTVLDRDGKPVPNAQVIVTREAGGTRDKVWESLTYADGRTMFFPQEERGKGIAMLGGDPHPGKFTIEARRDGFREEIRVNLRDDDQQGQVRGHHRITLEGTMHYGEAVPLDVLFLLDATGSMADEIYQIKTTLQSISQKVDALPARPDLRFGMVAYRDRGDEYVTRLYRFDQDVERFSRNIAGVEAEGGNDYPESLNQALHEAVNDMDWRPDAIRLMFLVADAPPHLDYDQDENYAREMVRAREQGIKIFAVASSGLDEQGERVFRQIAQQTMGKFIFILYRTGPQGSLETPHSVEQYTVNRLDSLIVGLIRDELEGLQAGSQRGEMKMR